MVSDEGGYNPQSELDGVATQATSHALTRFKMAHKKKRTACLARRRAHLPRHETLVNTYLRPIAQVPATTGGEMYARRMLKGHTSKIYAIHWSNTSNSERKGHLVSVSQDGKLIVWNGFTGNKVGVPTDDVVQIKSEIVGSNHAESAYERCEYKMRFTAQPFSAGTFYLAAITMGDDLCVCTIGHESC